MTKNKIRIQSKNEYVIEVNDNGDTISFDLTDPELMLKFDRAFNKVKGIGESIKRKEEEFKNIEPFQFDKQDMILTNEQRKFHEFIVKCFEDMRMAFDEFLGEGACQKIFGNSNYIDMYDDLIKQLQPHFEKMGLNAKKLKEEIIDKYQDKDEDIL